jgi:hypothetical protein
MNDIPGLREAVDRVPESEAEKSELLANYFSDHGTVHGAVHRNCEMCGGTVNGGGAAHRSCSDSLRIAQQRFLFPADSVSTPDMVELAVQGAVREFELSVIEKLRPMIQRAGEMRRRLSESEARVRSRDELISSLQRELSAAQSKRVEVDGALDSLEEYLRQPAHRPEGVTAFVKMSDAAKPLPPHPGAPL